MTNNDVPQISKRITSGFWTDKRIEENLPEYRKVADEATHDEHYGDCFTTAQVCLEETLEIIHVLKSALEQCRRENEELQTIVAAQEHAIQQAYQNNMTRPPAYRTQMPLLEALNNPGGSDEHNA